MKWLAVMGLVGFPKLAQAECGWLLMIPGYASSAREFAEATSRPVSQWVQFAAYDSAAACQEGRRKRFLEIWDLAQQVTAEEKAAIFMRVSEHRCLPASQVPVR
jgi:hypothetical protein